MQPRERHPACAELQGHNVGEEPDRQRQREEDQRGHPVGGEETVEDVGANEGAVGGEQLHPHHHELGEGDGGEEEGGGDVHPAH